MPKKPAYFLLLPIAVFATLSTILTILPFQAYGDGFTQENVEAKIGNRVITMFIKINPPIITSENTEDRYLQYRFFDSNTNQTIKNVAFYINVTQHDQKLMYDLFYTKSGFFTIKFEPGVGHWKVIGDKDPTLDAYTSETDEVNVQAPILVKGGLYHFNMEVFTLDFANTIITNQTLRPKFDAYLSVGDVYSQTINYKSNSYNNTIISYYDQIANYNFDAEKLRISFSMPFDWNPSRYQDRPLLVHEEIRIPKAFTEFSTPMYTASVNGKPIVGRSLWVDSYSTDSTIIHFVFLKQDIQALAMQMQPGTDVMNFALAPGPKNVSTSSVIFANKGGLGVKLGWDPNNIKSNSVNNLALIFFDAPAQQQITNDVSYDLKILDNNGGLLVSLANLVAREGVDSQKLNLPANGVYRIQIIIKSLDSNGIADTTRMGVATGDLVIPSPVTSDDLQLRKGPEFPFATALLAIAIMLIVLVSVKTRLKIFSNR